MKHYFIRLLSYMLCAIFIGGGFCSSMRSIRYMIFVYPEHLDYKSMSHFDKITLGFCLDMSVLSIASLPISLGFIFFYFLCRKIRLEKNKFLFLLAHLFFGCFFMPGCIYRDFLRIFKLNYSYFWSNLMFTFIGSFLTSLAIFALNNYITKKMKISE